MKININQITPEGLIFEEKVQPSELDLETETVKLREPVLIKARIWRFTNAVSVELALQFSLGMDCSRCLTGFNLSFEKNLKLNYSADNTQPIIDLNPDIRDEIILDYPIKPLCRPDCKGLCVKCGKNLNEGKCDCKFK
jgi:uncharacterized protein